MLLLASPLTSSANRRPLIDRSRNQPSLASSTLPGSSSAAIAVPDADISSTDPPGHTRIYRYDMYARRKPAISRMPKPADVATNSPLPTVVTGNQALHTTATAVSSSPLVTTAHLSALLVRISATNTLDDTIERCLRWFLLA